MTVVAVYIFVKNLNFMDAFCYCNDKKDSCCHLVMETTMPVVVTLALQTYVLSSVLSVQTFNSAIPISSGHKG